MIAIAGMANNDLIVMNMQGEASTLCEGAFVFVNHNKGRFLISGVAAAYHFENGKIVHRSAPGEAPPFGASYHYSPRLEPTFELGKAEHAFLTLSRSLAIRIGDEELEGSLVGVETAEQWMQHLTELAGHETQFCAVTAFLPPARPGLLKRI